MKVLRDEVDMLVSLSSPARITGYRKHGLFRLHEDQTNLGGGFENQFTVVGGLGGIVEGDELVGEFARTVAESDDAHANGFGSGRGPLGARRLAENLTDGFEEFGCVLRDETDGFSVDDESIVLDGGLDDQKFAGRDTYEQGEFEVDGAETVEKPDEAIGVAAADGEAAATEDFPTWGGGQVELFIVDAT
jgi:hypothetical protein